MSAADWAGKALFSRRGLGRAWLLGLCFAWVMVLAWGEAAQAKRLVPVDLDPAPGSGLRITVRDEAFPLAGARVWVESGGGRLLLDGQTGPDGVLSIALPDDVLAAGVAVTAAAPGHGAVSVLDSAAHGVTLELPINPANSYATMRGRLTGFRESDDETKAMVGLVAKAFEMSDLVQLDSSSFVSPLKDTINVFGSREIPSNIVLPDQTFPIYFIPVRVNKPTYRLPVPSGSSSRYFGVTGLVDVQESINAIRGGTAWDIVNLLEFSKVGVTRPVPAPGNGAIAVDIAADIPTQEILRMRPGRNTTPGGESKRLAVALWEPYTGVFVPTDVKLVQSDELALTAVEKRTAKVLDVLVSKEGDHFRGGWVPSTAATIPDAGLTAGLAVNALDGAWAVSGGADAQLIVAHAERLSTTSVGSRQYEDRWVVVAPRRAQVRLPAAALRTLRSELGTISHVSVDLLQTGAGEYPFIAGEAASRALVSMEKVRRELK